MQVRQLEWQAWQFFGAPKNLGAQTQVFETRISFAPHDRQFELNSPLQVVQVEWQSWQTPLAFM